MNTTPKGSALTWPVLALLVNASTWGLTWWPMRYFESVGLHSLWTTSAIFGFACVVIAATRPASIRGVLRAPWLWGLALVSGVTNSAFNWGVTVGEVVRVVLLFYLMPVWAALLARWLLGEPLTPGVVVRAGLALIGAGVVLWDPAVGLPLPASLGDGLGIVGGMGFALVNIILRRQAGTPATDRALAMSVGGLIIPLLLTPVLLSADLIGLPPPLAAHWVQALIGFALVMLVANLMLQYGAARLPSRVTSIVLLSEVLVAALSAAWFAGEALGPQVLAGGSLILLASLLAARAR
ncbi:MAG: hypothetical protein RL322_421 [Pseudomonadota bacterium]|jgi:drug/metabolite transporter (DMT)-like permease